VAAAGVKWKTDKKWIMAFSLLIANKINGFILIIDFGWFCFYGLVKSKRTTLIACLSLF
jgi:hypothetical protein